MNLTTFIVITILTIAFVVWMSNRTFKILTKEGESSLPKTVAHLNGLRMSTMFISFLGTIAGAISAVVLFLSHSDITQEAKVLAYVVAIAFATVFSFQLSSTLVSSEQTLGEKLQEQEHKKVWALVLVVVLSGLDYYSMSIGGSAFAEGIKNKHIEQSIKSNKVYTDSINTDRKLLNSKIARVEAINKLLDNPSTISVESSADAEHYRARIEKWKQEYNKAKSIKDKATYKRYVTINQTKLREELARLRVGKIAELKREKASLNRDINNLRATINNTAKYVDTKSNSAIESANSDKESTSTTISTIALGIVLFNIALGFISGRLNSQVSIKEAIEDLIEEEPKPIKEFGKSKKEMQEDYIAEAMKLYAKAQGYIANQHGIVYTHRLKFPRDAIVSKAKYLAAKDGIKLEIGNTTAKKIIDTHKQSEWLEKFIQSQTPKQQPLEEAA